MNDSEIKALVRKLYDNGKFQYSQVLNWEYYENAEWQLVHVKSDGKWRLYKRSENKRYLDVTKFMKDILEFSEYVAAKMNGELD